MTKGKGKKQVKNTPKKIDKKQQAYKDPIKQIKKNINQTKKNNPQHLEIKHKKERTNKKPKPEAKQTSDPYPDGERLDGGEPQRASAETSGGSAPRPPRATAMATDHSPLPGEDHAQSYDIWVLSSTYPDRNL